VQVRHFDLLKAAWVTSLPWILSLAVIPLGGALSDWSVKRSGATWGRRNVPLPALALSAANDEVYVGGYTYSSDFPGTAGGVQPMAGAGDALVARLAADLSSGLQHDTVVVPPAPLTIRIRQGDASVSALLKVKVRNADVGERVGHQIQLVVTDGTCPTGTVTGLPDFDPSTPGAQDTVLVVGGKRAAARIPLSFSAAAFTSLNRLVATRCTLQISAAAVVSGVNVDPTLSNNAATSCEAGAPGHQFVPREPRSIFEGRAAGDRVDRRPADDRDGQPNRHHVSDAGIQRFRCIFWYSHQRHRFVQTRHARS
jgi:hypothetical protein